jgi:hypothetical protein
MGQLVRAYSWPSSSACRRSRLRVRALRRARVDGITFALSVDRLVGQGGGPRRSSSARPDPRPGRDHRAPGTAGRPGARSAGCMSRRRRHPAAARGCLMQTAARRHPARAHASPTRGAAPAGAVRVRRRGPVPGQAAGHVGGSEPAAGASRAQGRGAARSSRTARRSRCTSRSKAGARLRYDARDAGRGDPDGRPLARVAVRGHRAADHVHQRAGGDVQHRGLELRGRGGGRGRLTLVPSIPHVGSGTLAETMQAAFGDRTPPCSWSLDLRLPGVRYAGRIVAAPVDESPRACSMLARDSDRPRWTRGQSTVCSNR